MNRLMMQQPLLVSTLLTHAERHHGSQQIVSRRSRATCIATRIANSGHVRAAWPTRSRLGAIRFAARVATLAWNGYRHMELYYAVSGSAVLHSLNPRLHPHRVVRPRRVWRAKFNTRGRTRAQTARTSP